MTSLPVLWYTWVFGKDDYHAEAMGLLLSTLVHKSPRSVMRVYTDKPQWYEWLKPLIEVEELTQTQVDAWAGVPRYLPRVKAKLIEKVSKEFAGHSVWLDTDMWSVAPLAQMEAQLDEGNTLMYLQENKISKGVTETERKYKTHFTTHDPECVDKFFQWNSGVVGVPAKRINEVSDAVALLDNMTDKGIYDFTREQMAFSAVFLKKKAPYTCEPYFRHYWAGNRVRWQPLLKQLVFKIAMHKHEPQVILEWIRSLPESSIPSRRSTWLERKKRSLRKHLRLLAPHE